MAPFNASPRMNPRSRRLSRALGIALLLAALSVAFDSPARGEGTPLEYQVKAAFLLNFTKFVQWPPGAFADDRAPLAICIRGEDPFGNTLDEIVKGEAVNGRELVVQRIARDPVPKTCQVLFVASSEKEVRRILTESGPGVLTVGEGAKFIQDGGIIAFVIEDRRVRFDIAQSAAAKARLSISSRLLNVARSVEK